MKWIGILLTVILAVVAFVIFLGVNSNSDSLGVNARSDFEIGTTLENFKLPDTNGKERSLDELKGKNGAVIVFLSVQCPVVKAYDERIVKLAEEFQAKDINFIGINSNATESAEEVKNHAAEKYKFPVLIDKGNLFADKLNATVTPEMFYFDAKNKLVYHGAIDNDRSGANVSSNYLREALDEHLAGKALTKAQTKAFGCSIKRAKS
jgi:peroxiredoxin